MKIKLLLISMLLPICAIAQKNDCKFIKFKDATKTWDMVQVHSSLGNLFLGKSDGKYVAVYQPRNFNILLSGNGSNMIYLRVDSVQFLFEGLPPVTVKVVGSGQVKNTSQNLKPRFENINFSTAFADNQLAGFKEGKLLAFRVFAEKEAIWNDAYNEKHREELKKAFTCIQ